MFDKPMRELKKDLLSELGRLLAPHGFTKRSKRLEQSFRKKVAIGWHFFHVSFIPHKDDFDVTADVAMRVDAVEDLLNQVRKDLSGLPQPKREQKETATIGAELGNIAGTGQRRWTVNSSRDVVPVASDIVEALKEIGLPYLEKYSDLDRLLGSLSRHDRNSWHLVPFDDVRRMVVVAVAHVLGRKDLTARFAEEGKRYFEGKKGFAAREFPDLLRHIGQP